MTVFTAAKKAALRADGAVIQEVYSSDNQLALELADLANEVAVDIAKSHEWRALMKIQTIEGGQSYDLPADYDRMTVAGLIAVPGEVDDVARMVQMLESDSMAYYTPWAIVNGRVNFDSAIPGRASFLYISNAYARNDNDGTESNEFTRDDDRFVLDERLLTLGLIWRWKAQKGLEYSEDLQTYELALGQAQTRDRGGFVLRSPRAWNGHVGLAYTNRDYR